MDIVEITVHASRTLPHPVEQFANVKPAVSMRATLVDGEDATEAVKTLQRKAEMLVEEHAILLRSSLEARDVMEREAKELQSLESSIYRQTQRLEELKQGAMKRSLPEWLEMPSSDE